MSLTKKELARLSLIERISSSISPEDSNLIWKYLISGTGERLGYFYAHPTASLQSRTLVKIFLFGQRRSHMLYIQTLPSCGGGGASPQIYVFLPLLLFQKLWQGSDIFCKISHQSCIFLAKDVGRDSFPPTKGGKRAISWLIQNFHMFWPYITIL